VDWSSINHVKISEFENDAHLVKLYQTLGRTGGKFTNNGIKPAVDFFFVFAKVTHLTLFLKVYQLLRKTENGI
jgi:hypothetical protein